MTAFMKMHFAVLIIGPALFSAVLQAFASREGKEISIIPEPLSLKREAGTFVIERGTTIILGSENKELQKVGEQLAARLRLVTGYSLELTISAAGKQRTNAILLALDDRDRDLGREGYRLTVTKKFVEITGSAAAGVFYGVQSFYQLLPVEVEKNVLVPGIAWSVPCVTIEDRPRFPWRGMHLDVGRHFFSKDSVEQYIDLLAMYKMNTFHWHLTEDQGWRIEIKKYPRLTTVGAWRQETMNDCTPHGGFYTQDDIREIVEYASERFITIVPEIEMPGHCLAALAAYPELSCSGGPFKVGTEWGVVYDVYCAGKEKTFQFLEDVIDEVASLFPGPFFHIGGDEVPKLRWSNCRWCQERIKAEGLKDESEMQSYFIKRVEKMLNARGKRLVGWDEILEGGLAPNATVMSWRGTQGGIDAAKSGHDVVMTPTSYCYFDYYQALEGEPNAIGGYLPIDTVYAYDPVPPELPAEEAKHILGAQGNVWTEWMPNFRQVEYMALPRLCAMSEVVWSDKSRRNFKDFQRRLEEHHDRLVLRDVNFRLQTPLGIGGRRIIFKDTVVTIENPVSHAAIYYTLNGQDPTSQSTPYTAPIRIEGEQTLKAVLVLSNGKVSNPVTEYFYVVDPKVNGLEYRYFEGTWDLLPDMNSLRPARSGRVFDIDLNSIEHRGENFGAQFAGFIEIQSLGEYTFSVASDDGSSLLVDGRPVVNNDGLHGVVEVTGKVILEPGKHRIEVQYFQRGGGRDLSVSIEGPQLPKQPLPPRMLFFK
jgi:hexosaminidase